MATVVIDPGHGGSKKDGKSSPNNATGLKGTKEKNLTLEIGKLVASKMPAPHKVILTRSTDENLSLKERATVARNNNAAVFVSIHFNAPLDPNDTKTQGTETLIFPNASKISKLLAQSVQNRVVSVTGYRDRKVKTQELGVLNLKYHNVLITAACLVEISFLTDPRDEERLKSTKYKDKLADAIVAGILDYLKSESTKTLKRIAFDSFSRRNTTPLRLSSSEVALMTDFALRRSRVRSSFPVESLSEGDDMEIIEDSAKESEADELLSMPLNTKLLLNPTTAFEGAHITLTEEEYQQFIDELIAAIEAGSVGVGGNGGGEGEGGEGGEGEGEGEEEGDEGEDG